MEIDPNPYQAPAGAMEPAPSPPATAGEDPAKLGDTVGRGGKIAGALLLVNAALVGAETIVLAARSSTMPGGLTSLVFDIAIGITLLSGKSNWKQWAIVRVVIGLVLFGAINAARGQYAGLVFQVLYSTALLLLLVGTPRTPRIAFGVAAFGAYALAEIVGIVSLASQASG